MFFFNDSELRRNYCIIEFCFENWKQNLSLNDMCSNVIKWTQFTYIIVCIGYPPPTSLLFSVLNRVSYSWTLDSYCRCITVRVIMDFTIWCVALCVGVVSPVETWTWGGGGKGLGFFTSMDSGSRQCRHAPPCLPNSACHSVSSCDLHVGPRLGTDWVDLDAVLHHSLLATPEGLYCGYAFHSLM